MHNVCMFYGFKPITINLIVTVTGNALSVMVRKLKVKPKVLYNVVLLLVPRLQHVGKCTPLSLLTPLVMLFLSQTL